MVCHLLEIFCTRSSAQLRQLITPSHLREQLSKRRITRSLVLAACASSVRFTVHKSIRGSHASRLADAIAREARRSMSISHDIWIQVNEIKAVCVLVDYEASRGRGRQAWVDIGKRIYGPFYSAATN